MTGIDYVLYGLVSAIIGFVVYMVSRDRTLPLNTVRILRLVAAAGAAGFILFNMTGFLLWRNEHRRLERLYSSGLKISARIVNLEQDRSVQLNYQYPYRIICEWKDPRTGADYSFKSRQIFHDPNFELRGKTSAIVYLDPRDYRNYDVDLSSVGIRSEE